MLDLDGMAARLVQVPGVVGVMLGGSRARGEHRPDSDFDLGLYYRGSLDLPALRHLAAEVSSQPADVTDLGGWGPWVNGGAWLRIAGVPVDWIFRDLDRVQSVWSACQAGTYEIGIQPGHPLGYWSPTYAGEVALGRILADPSGHLAQLQAETLRYPEPLRAALLRRLWEAEFLVTIAKKSAPAGDALHVSLCLSHAVGVMVQVIFAHHRRWCLNEKGALAVAERLDDVPPGFGARARALLVAPGETGAAMTKTVLSAAELVREVKERCEPG